MRNKFLFLLGIIIPVLLIFRILFLPGPAVWGDAPYFYPEALSQFVGPPSTWSSWGQNFGDSNKVLWLYPLMFLYGLFYKVFGLENDLIIRFLFYFPSLIFVFLTPYLFASYINLSKVGRFFASFFYGLNTYFILLIDGGQVGVALAYSLFPLVLLYLDKFITKPNSRNFFVSLISIGILTAVDVRFTAIALLSVIVLTLAKKLEKKTASPFKNLFLIVPLVIFLIGLNFYWIKPFLSMESQTFSSNSINQQVTILNSLFIFQPHWPRNEFGKLQIPPFYFIFLPLLVLRGFFFGKKKVVWILFFLIFVFLNKGAAQPLGEWYRWIAIHLPFGIAFRDSTKFFAPLILFAGILLGHSVVELTGYFKKWEVKAGIIFLIWIYLILLLFPALKGDLNGVLASRKASADYKILHNELIKDNDFFRTAWFLRRPPLGFHTEEKPALDAEYLVKDRPFASINTGTYDAFNFLNNDMWIDWFRVLGIKYLVFSGDARNAVLTSDQQKDWQGLLSLVSRTDGLEKINWNTLLPVYKISETKPKLFSVNRLISVVGGGDIYPKLAINNRLPIDKAGFVFFEDGKFDPRSLLQLPPESTVIALNNKDQNDLTMSFLQKYFISPMQNVYSKWAAKDESQLLEWRYDLLKNGLETKEFTYSKGIAFSTFQGEKIDFDIDTPKDGEYILVVRKMGRGDMGIDFNGEKITTTNQDHFTWYAKGPVSLKKGIVRVNLENLSGFQVLNTIGLIPKDDWEEAIKVSQEIVQRLKTVNMGSSQEVDGLKEILSQSKLTTVNYIGNSPVNYKVSMPEGSWIVFTDHYNKGWVVKKGDERLQSFPIYSMVNGFYVKNGGDLEVKFEPQKDLVQGAKISFITLSVLVAGMFWFYSRSRRYRKYAKSN